MSVSRDVAFRALMAAVIALVCWYFGASAWHAIALGAAITVAWLAADAAASAAGGGEPAWRPLRRGSADGARRDVDSLAWSLRGGLGGVGLAAERELRQVARHRLALEGLDLGDPAQRGAIERRIGASAYRALTRRRWGRLRLASLARVLDALDALNPVYYPLPRGGGLAHRGPSPAGPRRARER